MISAPAPAPAALLLTGTVGAGKSTTADHVGELLAERGVPHAVVDLDELRRSWPAPPGDPFQQDLELENLRAVAAVYRRRGAARLVLAGVLEDRDSRAAYADAVGMPLTVCRLRLAVPAVRDRLDVRHAGHASVLAWHRHRAGELHAILEAARVEDHVVDVEGLAPAEVAAAVLRAVGWAG
ncbi:adenylyl-sulfate kinase [Cellulosimicrobium cellulans]|uniref:adenylyl-sulfate kinase n=1 Tax=Cellulosimicrobium cellulans TaxID=1710 RepID=UPI0021CB4E6E|nr:adenylyl-sulfate kinase [Cellulosimicrobium cellulans]